MTYFLCMHRMRNCPPASDFVNPANNSDYLTRNERGYEAFTQGKEHRGAMQLMPHVGRFLDQLERS